MAVVGAFLVWVIFLREAPPGRRDAGRPAKTTPRDSLNSFPGAGEPQAQAPSSATTGLPAGPGYIVRSARERLDSAFSPVERTFPPQAGETVTEKRGVAFFSARDGRIEVRKIVFMDCPYQVERIPPSVSGETFWLRLYAADGEILYEKPFCAGSLPAADPLQRAAGGGTEIEGVVCIPLFEGARTLVFCDRQGRTLCNYRL